MALQQAASEQPRQTGQADPVGSRRVLIVSPSDLSPDLGQTILWRRSVERVVVPDAAAGYLRARTLRPNLVIIDGTARETAEELVRQLRRDSETRSTAIAVLSLGATLAEEDTLRAAGANVVFAGRVDPTLWDARLEELLNVPRRRAARIPVTLEAWSHAASPRKLTGTGLNISIHGVLIETAEAIAVGTKLDLHFQLPGHGEVRVVGEVVRDAGSEDGRPRCGVKFLVLRADARALIESFVEHARPALVEPFSRRADSGPDAPGVEEREAWESELRASNAWKTAILESVLDCIVTLDHEGRIVEFNPAAEQAFGRSRSEVLGSKAVDVLSPNALRDEHRAKLATVLGAAGPAAGERLETMALRSDGTQFPVELTVAPMLVGRRRLATVFLRDITQRRRDEESLRASARQFRALFEGAMDAMAVMDDAGSFVETNAAACALYGISRDELLGHRLSAGVEPGFDEPAVWQALRETGRARGELRVQRADGALRDVEFTMTADFLPGRHLAVLRDVTEPRQLEAQFRHAQRMEPLGRLAGGVAHDFNNLLNVITGYGELLMRALPADSGPRQKADNILKAAARAAGLTQQLLAFSRRQVLQLRVFDLNGVVADVEKMLGRLIGEDVHLTTALHPQLGRIKADPGQLEQVLMNLAVNARDAMPQGGTLRIATRNVDLDQRFVRDHMGSRPGPYVVLEVSDDGTGMDAETLRHIFEPFFTTKKKGQGTGLGLATVYGIVKQSGGYIWVESQPGKGATFQIFLPRVEDAADAARPAVTGAVPARGVETVLLVEDDQMVRRMTREVLEASGYRVLEASGGEEALRATKSFAEPIDLLLTDVVLPGMSGPEVVRRVSAARPTLKVLFVSGYTDDAVVPQVSLENGTAFLQKPFTAGALEHKVRELLDAARA